MESDRNLFFTEADFCKPGVIQGFNLNFNLYLLVRILQQIFRNRNIIPINGKIIKNKIFLIKVGPISLINLRLVGRRVREYVRELLGIVGGGQRYDSSC